MLTQDTINTLTTFFRWVDTDGDGYITIEEIKNACGVDLNGDGLVDDEEKMVGAKAWIETYLPLQDSNADQKLSLEELLAFNLG